MHVLASALCRFAAATALLLVAGCTTTTINPTKVERPSRSYAVVALADITAVDAASQSYVPFFRRGFAHRIKTLKLFDNVLDPAPARPPPSSIVVSGRLTEIDKGDRAERVFIGFGAGRARLRGDFEIRDAQGATLATFEGGKAYSGGPGIGGFDLIDIDDLMEKFGEETADTVWRWSKGRDLDGPSPPRN